MAVTREAVVVPSANAMLLETNPLRDDVVVVEGITGPVLDDGGEEAAIMCSVVVVVVVTGAYPFTTDKDADDAMTVRAMDVGCMMMSSYLAVRNSGAR